MSVDPGQGKAPRNTSSSKEASLQVLTQNKHSSTVQKQKSLVFPASIEGVLFGQRLRKIHQKKKALISNFSSADTPTKEPQRPNCGPWQFYLKGPKDSQLLVSRSNIKQIAKEETAYSRPSFEFCTVLQALQEVDPLLQQRRLHLAETRSVEQSINRALASVLATIVEETIDLTPHPSQRVEVTEQP